MEEIATTAVADSGALLSLRLQDALAERLEISADLCVVAEDYLPPGQE